MKNIKIATRILITAIIVILGLGTSSHTQAMQSETDQFSCANVSEIPLLECKALVALYNSTDGPNWNDATGWLVTATPCSWYGVTCGVGHVTELRLDGEFSNYFGLQGDIPIEIGNLTSLTTLDLSENQLISLPIEIGNLTSLTTLNLRSNRLSSIPSEIGNLTSLIELSLHFNLLSSLPTEIGNLTSLTRLELVGNQLRSLPIEIGNLTSLTTLNLSFNELRSLSVEIGNLTSLTTLHLSFNDLSSMPTEIGNLTSLTTLNLGGNQLSSLPSEIGNLISLTTLYLFSNQLSSLPTEIGNLTSLTGLWLSSNQLSSLPTEIGNLTSLTTLNLRSNRLSSIPSEIGNLTSLTTLSLDSNQLSSVPSEIGNLTNLTWLGLSSNQLSSLPPEIGNLTSLTGLWLSSNQLSSLPTEIGNLTSLTTFNFDNFNSSEYLNLAYNRLVIPDSDLRSFITKLHPGWASSQTIAPIDMKATVLGEDSIELIWTPIAFQDKGGYYEISVADGGSFTVHGTTANKSTSRYVIDSLTSETPYDIRIRTYTPAHAAGDLYYTWDDQRNELWSDYSSIISATIPSATNISTSLEEDEEPLGHKLFLPFVGN